MVNSNMPYRQSMMISRDNDDELLPMVDKEGNVLGSVRRGMAHDGSKTLHPVVHLHVFNSNGDIYLQKRLGWKSIQPDKWDTATGGHIGYGEKIEEALKREVLEELGISCFDYVSLGHYVFESFVEKELVYVNKTVYNGLIMPSKEELAGGKFWSKDDIELNLGKGIFTPNFEFEYDKFFCHSILSL